jgi:hypothetical protein
MLLIIVEKISSMGIAPKSGLGESFLDLVVTIIGIRKDITLERLNKIRPDIDTIIFQSDNAKCYQGGVLVEALDSICKAQHYKLECYVHTETQDGKCSIDGHFAVGMRVIRGI